LLFSGRSNNLPGCSVLFSEVLSSRWAIADKYYMGNRLCPRGMAGTACLRFVRAHEPTGRISDKRSGRRETPARGACLADQGGGTRSGVGEPYSGITVRRRVPTLGLDSLALILLSSYSVHAGWIGADMVNSVRAAVETSHAITGFICVLIVGSILSLDLRPLARTLPRLLLVVVLASMVALLAGAAAGQVAGFSASEALFLVVVPVMGGGLNAGALPLSLGYGSAFGNGDQILGTLLPPVLLGNLVAVVVAGVLGYFGHRRGTTMEEMRLARKAGDEVHQPADRVGIAIAVALLLAMAVAAYWVQRLTGISEPVFLLALSGILLVTNVLPPAIRSAIVAVYRFSAKVFVFPVLVVVGLLYSPWDVLLAGFSPGNLLVVTATVAGLYGGGYLFSLLAKLDPVDGSLVAVSRAAMGGTGDIAILSAARRLDLMPFAQIATRLGGAATVLIALLAL
jgi:Na+/citrate or Na+/malate symporter